MKTMSVITSFLIVLLISACKKDASTPSVGQGVFTGTLSNNTSFNVSGSSTLFLKDTVNGIVGITIYGLINIQKSDTTQTIIEVNGIKGTGTYPLETPNTNTYPMGIIIYVMGHKDGYSSLPNYGIPVPSGGPGNVVITSISNTAISGTYTTQMTDSVNNIITMKGTFNGTFLH